MLAKNSGFVELLGGLNLVCVPAQELLVFQNYQLN